MIRCSPPRLVLDIVERIQRVLVGEPFESSGCFSGTIAPQRLRCRFFREQPPTNLCIEIERDPSKRSYIEISVSKTSDEKPDPANRNFRHHWANLKKLAPCLCPGIDDDTAANIAATLERDIADAPWINHRDYIYGRCIDTTPEDQDRFRRITIYKSENYELAVSETAFSTTITVSFPPLPLPQVRFKSRSDGGYWDYDD
jgi:hypothetical protein